MPKEKAFQQSEFHYLKIREHIFNWTPSYNLRLFLAISKILTLALLFSFTEISAQQYPITHYTKDRGLPGNQVLTMYQDSQGYMWFSTSSGLIKYNGKEYELLGKKDGLLNDWPMGITDDKKGSLWISFDKGVSKVTGRDIKNWVLKNSEDRYSIYTDSYNRIWVYSSAFKGDVYYFINDSLHNFSQEYNFKNQIILSIAEDREGGLFFITGNSKLFRLFAGNISEYQLDELAGSGIRYSFFDSDNNLIICARKGLGVVEMKSLFSKPVLNWILNKPLNQGLQSKNGTYWFATSDEGIFRLKNLHAGTTNDIVSITEKNGLLNNRIHLIYEDYEGNIWIGYELKGISKLSSLMFQKFGNDEGLNANAILSLSWINGVLFCSTENGIFKFSGNHFEKTDISGKLSGRWFTCMLPISQNEVLVGAVPGLYKILKSSTIEYFGLSDQRKVIQAMIKDHTGKIWIGTQEGLVTLEGANTFINQDFDVSGCSVSNLLEVGNKDLYISTDKGLYVVENGTIPYGEKKIIRPGSDLTNGILSGYVNDLAIDSDNRILAATGKGLAIIKDNKLLDSVQALNNVWISVLYLDSKGRVWAGGTSGLYSLRLVNGKYKVEDFYTQRAGLASDEFTLNHTIIEDKDGKIYFGSFGGLTIYNPAEDFSVSTKPRNYIAGVKINDSLYSFSKASGIKLSYNENKISFYCEGLSFCNEDAVRFEYYMSPIEKKWGNTTATPLISYGYLEPGEYTFYVRAVNQFGIAGNPQSIAFVILVPFWKRPLFLFFVVIFLLYIGYKLNYQRQKHIRNRNLILEKLVDEKTVDLEKSKTEIENQYNQLIEAQKELVQKRELEKANLDLEKANSEIQQLKEKVIKENIYLREKQGAVQEIGSIIGESEAIQIIRNKVKEIATLSSTVLITGQTGVGKNLIAEAIHGLSERKDHALVMVNCAAIPDSLVESELFGHEKGAFTGATERRIGKFEIADKSTILLDEIGDMNLSAQAKVLNVLQSKTITRVGGNQEINIDVRIIAATNHDLSRLVAEGKFRQDLFYRINVYSIYIPLLRDRPEDIELIAKFFVDKYAKLMNKKINLITKRALKVLYEYNYPGNIRELENIIHRAVIICKGNTLTDEDILVIPTVQAHPADGEYPEELMTMEEMEIKHITRVLQHTNWKIRGKNGAAEILGVHYNTLRSKMEKLGIPFVMDKISK